MSRWGACFVVTLLLIPALAAAAGSQDVRDDFKLVSFSGNDGSLPWAGPWTEVGESDGPASGQVEVGSINCSASKCLQLSGGALGQSGAQREADLSTMVTAVLNLDLIVDGALVSTGTLQIQARVSGSGTWVTLKSYTLLLQNGQFSESFDVSRYAGSEFEVRFVLNSLLGGDRAYFDEVTIEGTVAATSSSTSTSSSSSTPNGVPSTAEPGITANPPGSISPGDGVEDPTSSTSTTARDGIVIVPLSGPTSASDGLRAAGVGLLADYRSGMMGDTDFENVEVLGANLESDFSMAVEVFEAMRLWIAALALVVTAAVVGGMDVVRTRVSGEKHPHDDNSLS